MNASTQLHRVDNGPIVGEAQANRRKITLSRTHTRKIGRGPTILDARINSLKVLALTLLREVEYLEGQDATATRGALDLWGAVHRFEAELIRSALIRTGGRQRPAARLLGMKTTTLNSKVKRYQIELKEETDESEK